MTNVPGMWRKSSHSADTDCVEVFIEEDGAPTAIRDSKNPGGPTLTVNVAAFIEALQER